MSLNGFLGIDIGTQGLAVVFVDQQLNVIASGDGHYSMVDGLEDGCYEQNPADWLAALKQAANELHLRLNQISQRCNVLAIGIAGQMHGEVLLDASSKTIGSARLWCDARNESEGCELTDALQVKIPKRMTVARWLWTTRQQSDKAAAVAKMTTPAGWLHHCLTGEFSTGIGDASGMFPIDPQTSDFSSDLLLQAAEAFPSEFTQLRSVMPAVAKAGQHAGTLNEFGAELLGLHSGIPFAPAEGDQPAALAGSMITEPGMVSVSFGTSVCANFVGDKTFQGVHPAIDHFCAVDGKPINMVFLRNGTTFMNTIVEMFTKNSGKSFAELLASAAAAQPDAGGILAIPFMDDEPGLGVRDSGNAALVHLNEDNASAANCISAALVATMFNLKTGMQELARQEFACNEIILSGGLTKTIQWSQVLADVLAAPVSLQAGADEGTAVGAALLAKYRWHVLHDGQHQSWSQFVSGLRPTPTHRFLPNGSSAYQSVYERYLKLLEQFSAPA